MSTTALERRGARFVRSADGRPKGLVFSADMSFEDWALTGQQVARIADRLPWLLGDWIAFGQYARWGEKYDEAIEATGLDYQTLRNYASIADRFQMSRRRDELSFAHHAEVMALPPAEADRMLEQAMQNGWNRAQLRDALLAGKEPKQLKRGFDIQVTLGLDQARRDRWHAAAETRGLGLPEFVITVVDEAVAA